MSNSINYEYRYAVSSTAVPCAGGGEIRLSTSGGIDANSAFFQGQFVAPRDATRLLRAVAHVVGSRFHVPAAMLEKIIRLSDPVVTCGDGVLRFEGLSGCCSAYVRVDFMPASYRGVTVGRGTTNVDFNPAMLAALAQVEALESVSLSVGAGELALLRGTDSVVEKKVSLPVRWIRSLCEVQACQSRMVLRAELNRAEAVRFLRALPRTPMKAPCWLVASGNTLRLSPRAQPHAVRLSGHERLRALEDLAPAARRLLIYAEETSGTSEWVLEFDAMRIHLALSGETWRGFSGEGQAIDDLAGGVDPRTLDRLLDLLDWQACFAPRLENFAPGTSDADLRNALAAAGSRGLLGYDVRQGAYFHRVLPFDLEKVERMHPRLGNANKLVARGGMNVVANVAGGVIVEVPGSDVTHRVHLDKSGDTCTCPWHAKHQRSRGPCKHILAARMFIASDHNKAES